MTLEEAAREVRYSFLSDVCRTVGTQLIATGHTQNDNVETILLHIVRGSGTRGLIGLKPLTARTIGDRELVIVRPMLDITREELVNYCQRFDLAPRIDASNLELSPLRNKIRLKLLPMLERYNQNIADALLRLSANTAGELDYLDIQMAQLWSMVVKREGYVITLDKKGLQDVHPALKRHLLRNCLDQLPGGLKDIESCHIEDMLSLMEKPSGRRIDLPYGLIFMVGFDSYWLGKEGDLPNPFPTLVGEYPLTITGITGLPGWRVEAKIVPTLDKHDNSLVSYMDADEVGQKISVRTWKRGDRFQPLGMGCEKKLGEFMIDARIPRIWRHNIPVVVSSSGIVWLVGYRSDDRVKVTSKTKRVLRLEFNRV
jgi:tRNA(Ile)-lysidine synthase